MDQILLISDTIVCLTRDGDRQCWLSFFLRLSFFFFLHCCARGRWPEKEPVNGSIRVRSNVPQTFQMKNRLILRDVAQNESLRNFTRNRSSATETILIVFIIRSSFRRLDFSNIHSNLLSRLFACTRIYL